MPHLSSHIPSSSIFHGLIFPEFLGIARDMLRIPDIIPRASVRYLRTVAQRGNKNKIRQRTKKLFQRVPEVPH